MNFETVRVTLEHHVAIVALSRPDKANAMNHLMWHEIRRALQWADETKDVRVVIIEGDGKHFTSGIDLQIMAGLVEEVRNKCEGRTRENLRRFILDLQEALSSIEQCRKPVIAAIHGACVGGGVDLISCADMRYCSSDAYFSIKEIDIGMAADVGTLQRLPKLIWPGIVRELAYTGRKVFSEEAQAIGLVNKAFDSIEALRTGVREVANSIAEKSPLAIRGTKEMLNYSRDHSVQDGLSYVATWNSAMLFSDDLNAALEAGVKKQRPVFEN